MGDFIRLVASLNPRAEVEAGGGSVAAKGFNHLTENAGARGSKMAEPQGKLS